MFNRCFCLMKHRPVVAINRIKHYSTMTEINERMKHILGVSAANSLGPKNTLKQILQLQQELRSKGGEMNNETFEHILSAYANAGEHNKALWLHKMMISRGIQPEKSFYSKALRSLARAGDAVSQAQLLRQMEYFGYQKTTKIYESMFRCMRENLELERALDTLDVMKKEKIRPSLLSYLEVIETAVRLHEPAVAFDILQLAEKMPEFDIQSNSYVYTSLLRSATFEGNYKIVLYTWNKVVNECNIKPDEGLLLYILNIAGKHSDPKLATEAIKIVGESGYPYREAHFMPLIEAFVSTGDYKNTFQVFSAMRNVGVIPNKKTALPVAYKLGKDKNAIIQAKEALESCKNVDVAAFNLVIHSLAYNKENEEAIRLFRNADQLGVTPNSETLDAALDACIHSKDAELGKSIYEQLTDDGIEATVTTLSKMVTLMCTQEDYEDAFVYLEKMKQLDMIPLRGCYFKLVKTLTRARDSRVSMALEDMKVYGYELSRHLTDFMEIGEKIKLKEQEYADNHRNPISIM